MPAPLLTVLKYVFLAFLYLFFLRVLRAVWIELREPKTVDVTRTPDGDVRERVTVPAAPDGRRADSAALTTASPALADGEATVTVPVVGARRPGAPPGRLLLVQSPSAAGTAFPLADELTVGRAPGCSVSLPEDTFVSSVHARVFRRGERYQLEDLGSTNGTFVNGERIGGPVALSPGDRFQVGQSVLELQA